MSQRTLDQLDPGESGVILGIDGPAAAARRLMELGLSPGATIELVRRAPLGDPLELRIRKVHLSLRRSQARHVRVGPA